MKVVDEVRFVHWNQVLYGVVSRIVGVSVRVHVENGTHSGVKEYTMERSYLSLRKLSSLEKVMK